MAVLEQEGTAVERIDRQRTPRIVAMCQRAGNGEGEEPHHHDRTEERGHLGGAAPLDRERQKRITTVSGTT